jgi:hypothetical protein
MQQDAAYLKIIFSQLAYSLPVLLVCIAAVIVCFTRWQQAPTVALFCLIGFGLIAFGAIFGPVLQGLIFRAVEGDHVRMATLYGFLAIFRTLFHVAGLALILVAVFSGRERKNQLGPLGTTGSKI